jgi:hypothetical protein
LTLIKALNMSRITRPRLCSTARAKSRGDGSGKLA